MPEMNFTIDEEDQKPAGDALERAQAMGMMMLAQEHNIDGLKQQLKMLEEAYNKTRLEDLPTLMTEVGLTSFSLLDGTKIDLKKEVTAGITEEKRKEAHDWLRENDYGGIIKCHVGVDFGKNEMDEAEGLLELIGENIEQEPTMEEKVHSSTLKAFIKERLEASDTLPMELFGVHEVTVAKITPPKKPKRRNTNGK